LIGFDDGTLHLHPIYTLWHPMAPYPPTHASFVYGPIVVYL